jgi:hypothetical protein
MNWGISMRMCVCFLCIFLISFNCFSYENKEIITYKGKVGFFFDEETGTKILQDLAELRKIKAELIPQLEAKIRLQEMNLEKYKLSLELAEKIAGKWESAFKDSEKLRYAEIEKLSEKIKWYKTPSFVFVMGIVSGGLLSVGLAFGLNNGYKK